MSNCLNILDGLFITTLETKDMLSSRQGWLVKNFYIYDESPNLSHHWWISKDEHFRSLAWLKQEQDSVNMCFLLQFGQFKKLCWYHCVAFFSTNDWTQLCFYSNVVNLKTMLISSLCCILCTNDWTQLCANTFVTPYSWSDLRLTHNFRPSLNFDFTPTTQ